MHVGMAFEPAVLFGLMSVEIFRSQTASYGKRSFGREEDIAFLDRAWANKEAVLAVTISVRW